MNTIPGGKKKLSGLAITSAVVAILFSIAAAVMVILPIVSLNSSTMNLDAQWNGMFLSPCSESPSDLLNAGAEKGDAMSQATVFITPTEKIMRRGAALRQDHIMPRSYCAVLPEKIKSRR